MQSACRHKNEVSFFNTQTYQLIDDSTERKQGDAYMLHQVVKTSVLLNTLDKWPLGLHWKTN